MGALRTWILVVAVGSFAAGLTVGVAVPELLAASGQPSTPAQYARDLVRKYGLSKDQERRLLMVLQEDQRVELEILRNADWSQLPQELQNQRLVQRRKTEQRIRFVLDPEQRALYDRDSRPHSAGGSTVVDDREDR